MLFRSSYLWSFFWFLQEMVIYGLGARVFWKRPRDDAAKLFFWLCMVTVGAYMGGYHWTEIVGDPLDKDEEGESDSEVHSGQPD